MNTEEVQILPPAPFSAILCGASMTGKSTFLLKLLKAWPNIYPNDPIRKIVLIHKFGNQPVYSEMQQLFGEKLLMTSDFNEDTFEEEKVGNPKDGMLICILDDVLHEVSSNPLLTHLVIGGVHHLNICTFIVGHNLYASRHVNWMTVARNVTCLILFQMPRDMTVFSTLNRQLYPGSRGKNYVAEAFKMASKDQMKYNDNKFTYLIVDCSVDCPNKYRLRTGIGDEHKFCYMVPE